MQSKHTTGPLSRNLNRPKGKQQKSSKSAQRHYRLEPMETRLLLSTVVVNTIVDGPHGAGLTSLRDAIAIADASHSPTTIKFDSTVFAAPQAIILNSGPLKLTNVPESTTLIGPSAGVTVNGAVATQIFIVATHVTASMSNIDVLDGNSTVANNAGGITNLGTLTLTNAKIEENLTTGEGAGIYNAYGAKITIKSSTISGNSAAIGGGMYNHGTATLSSGSVTDNVGRQKGGGLAGAGVFTITDISFSDNNGGPMGGGMEIAAGGKATITNSTFYADSADDGSAIYNLGMMSVTGGSFQNEISSLGGVDNFGNATFSGVGFMSDGRFGLSLAGGAVNNEAGAVVSFSHCDLSGNYADVGGALFNSGIATLSNSTVSGNSAYAGGGIYSGGSPDAKLVLVNTTISGNSATQSPSPMIAQSTGGGVFIESGTAKLTNSTVKDNDSTAFGGGIENVGGLTMTNTTISGNSTGGYGGGVYNRDTMTLTGCTITGNSASSNGGGIYNVGMADLSQVTLDGNNAGAGGGIANVGPKADLTLTNVAFVDNIGGAGAGVYNSDKATVTAVKTTFSGGSAQKGGAIFNFADITLINSTISGNIALNGGGIYQSDGGGGGPTLQIYDSTIAGNTATMNSGSDGVGGGIDNAFGQVKVANTILAGNTSDISGPDASGAFDSLGHNLVGETDGSTGWTATDLTGTIASPLNAKLNPLFNNGGFTKTMLPKTTSPVINAGSNALIPAGVTGDQRGQKRIAHVTVEIGSVEVQNGISVPVVC